MDIGKSFSFVFEDPRWLTKVLIGTVVLLISTLLTPILIGFLGMAIVVGYALDVIKNVRRGDKYPLPEWQDRWGEWLVLGLKLLVVALVWSLPALLLSIPMAVGLGLTEQQGTEAIGGLLAACFGCLTLLWTVVLILAGPALYIRVAESEQISAGLKFGDILAFTRDNIGEVIIASLLYVVASFVIGTLGLIVGTILCLVGLIVTVPAAQLITMLVQSHLYAQVGMGSPKPWQQAIVPAEYIPEPPPAPPAIAAEPEAPIAPAEEQ